MACKAKATAERNASPLALDDLKRLLTYDSEAGQFYWRVAIPGRHAAGDLGGYPTEKGYIRITVRGQEYAAHRLAWFYMTGGWPKDQLDHINRDKADNRWCNLREATNGENMMNRPRESFAPEGATFLHAPYRGVYYKQAIGLFCARIGNKHIGSFATAEDARDAYLREADRLYGEFASKQD